MDQETEKSLSERLDAMEGKTVLMPPFEREPEPMEPMVPRAEEAEPAVETRAESVAVEAKTEEPQEPEIPAAYHALNSSIQQIRNDLQSMRQAPPPRREVTQPQYPAGYNPEGYATNQDLINTQQHLFQYFQQYERQLVNAEERRAVDSFQQVRGRYKDFDQYVGGIDPRSVFANYVRTYGVQAASQIDWAGELDARYKATKFNVLEKEVERLTKEVGATKSQKAVAEKADKTNILKLPSSKASVSSTDAGYLKSTPRESMDAYSKRLAKHLGIG